MQEMNTEELARHLESLGEATEDDRDELLRDFLVAAWPTKVTQDN